MNKFSNINDSQAFLKNDYDSKKIDILEVLKKRREEMASRIKEKQIEKVLVNGR